MSAPCRYCDPSIPGIDGMCLEHLRAEAHRLHALVRDLAERDEWRSRLASCEHLDVMADSQAHTGHRCRKCWQPVRPGGAR